MGARGRKLPICVRGVLVVCMAASGAPGQPAAWTIETIGIGEWPAAVVDEEVRPHICYSNPAETLVHAYRDNACWHFEPVDFSPGGEIWTKSMARGQDGSLHVAYLGGRLSPYDFVGYAYRDVDGWHAEHFQTTYPVWGPSLALDSELRPHVVYPIMFATNVLRHAWRDATGWHFEGPNNAAFMANMPDIAVDGSGQIHIAYSEQSNSDETLMYGLRGASGWIWETVDTDTYMPGVLTASLALDGAGSPHLSYVKTDDTTLRYASKATGAWSFEAVSPTGGAESISSLRIDESGMALVTWWDAGVGAVMYACKTPGGWAITPIDTTVAGVMDLCLALDPYGNPHVVCDDATNGVVRLARAGLPLIVNDYGSSYELAWGPVGGTLFFWIYAAANAPYFEPGLDPPYQNRIAVLGAANSTWSTTMGMGEEDNYTYRIVALDVNNHEIARSHPAGEFDFITALP